MSIQWQKDQNGRLILRRIVPSPHRVMFEPEHVSAFLAFAAAPSTTDKLLGGNVMARQEEDGAVTLHTGDGQGITLAPPVLADLVAFASSTFA